MLSQMSEACTVQRVAKVARAHLDGCGGAIGFRVVHEQRTQPVGERHVPISARVQWRRAHTLRAFDDQLLNIDGTRRRCGVATAAADVW